MNKTMKYVGMLSILLICLTMAPMASAAIQQQSMPLMQCPAGQGCAQTGYYPQMGYPQMGCGNMPNGTMYPYPMDYCMHWQQPQLQPVQVMVPGRWEYQPVWLPGYPTTLYRPVPGYWQRTGGCGQPGMMGCPNANGGLYTTPYQAQPVGGFNPYGYWQGTVPAQGQPQMLKEK